MCVGSRLQFPLGRWKKWMVTGLCKGARGWHGVLVAGKRDFSWVLALQVSSTFQLPSLGTRELRWWVLVEGNPQLMKEQWRRVKRGGQGGGVVVERWTLYRLLGHVLVPVSAHSMLIPLGAF